MTCYPYALLELRPRWLLQVGVQLGVQVGVQVKVQVKIKVVVKGVMKVEMKVKVEVQVEIMGGGPCEGVGKCTHICDGNCILQA